MKNFIQYLVLVSICTSAFAEVFDYTISDTYYDETLTLNDQSVQVTGAGVFEIIANGASYVEIIDTTPHEFHIGGITGIQLYGTSIENISGGEVDHVSTYDDSILNISGGKSGVDSAAYNNSVVNMSGGTTGSYFVCNNAEINLSGGEMGGMWLRDNATFIVSGGSVRSITSYQYSDVTKHITFICDVDGVNYIGDLLTGNWLDGTSFSITLNDQSGYDSVYSNINFVPEPATILLFGLGAAAIRRKR